MDSSWPTFCRRLYGRRDDIRQFRTLDSVFFNKTYWSISHFCLPKAQISQVLLAIYLQIMLGQRLGKCLIDELIDAFIAVYRFFEVDGEHLTYSKRLAKTTTY